MLLLPKLWGLNGVFYAMPFADGLSAIVTLVFILYELKGLGKLTG
jgi:Na+-driven multidrug efflux pump